MSQADGSLRAGSGTSAPAPAGRPAAPAGRPAVREPAPWFFPTPWVTRLDNGLTVLSYDAPGQHVWSVRLGLPGPLAAEPRGREGVGTIMARCLDEGSHRHTAQEMAELLERRGVAIGAGVGDRGLVIEMDMPKRNADAALELLREAVLDPVFPEPEVRRHVRTRLAEIEQERANPGQRAALEFARTYYRPDDRFSRATAGEPATVAELTRDDVAAHHRGVLDPARATLVVAGDLTGTDVPALVDGWLGSWQAEPGKRPAAPAADQSRPGDVGVRADDAARVVVVDRPESVQSELYLGCAGPERRVDTGWAPYPVLSFVVGGSPQARIDAVLREDLGYTYGIRCVFRPRMAGGLFVVSGSVRSEVTAPALTELVAILNRARDGFTEEETRSGSDFVRQTAPGRYATADALADEAAARALEGLTTEHTTETLRDMAHLTPQRLSEAYRRYVDGVWTIVVVGDAAQIADPIRGLGLGEVTVVDA